MSPKTHRSKTNDARLISNLATLGILDSIGTSEATIRARLETAIYRRNASSREPQSATLESRLHASTWLRLCLVSFAMTTFDELG